MNISFEKSFASHEKAKYWSDKNEVKPFQISKGTDKNIGLIVMVVVMNF